MSQPCSYGYLLPPFIQTFQIKYGSLRLFSYLDHGLFNPLQLILLILRKKMEKSSETQSHNDFELQEMGQISRRSGSREDSDSAALREAGKSPVLKVCLHSHFIIDPLS